MPAVLKSCAASFKSNVERFPTPKGVGAEPRVLGYTNDRTVEKSIKDSPIVYSHFNSVVPRLKYPPMVEDTVYDTDTGPKMALTTALEHSPRRVAAAFSDTPRWREPRDNYDMVYDVDKGNKLSLAKATMASPRKYSAMSSVTQRMDDAKPQIPPYNVQSHTIGTYVAKSGRKFSVMKSITPRAPSPPPPPCRADGYDVEYGKNASVATAAAASAASTVPFRSTTDRFTAPKPTTSRFFNLDSGHKMSLWKSVQESPRLMANIHSNTKAHPPLSARSTGNDVFATYNIDCGPKESLSTGVMNSPRVVSCMASTTPRFRMPTLATDAVYEIDALNKRSLATEIQHTPHRYTMLRTKTKRFPDSSPREAAQEKMYDVEFGNKASLERAVEKSSIKYANVHSTIPRFKADKRMSTEDDYEALLKNPGNMDLRFEIRGNTVVKKTSERAVIIVGKQ